MKRAFRQWNSASFRSIVPGKRSGPDPTFSVFLPDPVHRLVELRGPAGVPRRGPPGGWGARFRPLPEEGDLPPLLPREHLLPEMGNGDPQQPHRPPPRLGLFQQRKHGPVDRRAVVGGGRQGRGPRDLGEVVVLHLQGYGPPPEPLAPQSRRYPVRKGEQLLPDRLPVPDILVVGVLVPDRLDLVLRLHLPLLHPLLHPAHL